MKTLLTAILFTLCTSVSAQDGEMFAKAKEQHLSNLDKRIALLQEQKTCASAATTKDAMNACRDAHKTAMKSLKESNESFKEGMKSERKSKRDERKKK
ncbi:MAG: hypothetical protein V4598_11100 [Bdellovibrionota bacterium]